MKNLLFFLLGFVIVFSIGAACATSLGTTPINTVITLSANPNAQLLADIIAAEGKPGALLDNIINQADGTFVRKLPATQKAAETIQSLSKASDGWKLTGSILTATGVAISKWQPLAGAAAIGIGYFANYEFDLKKAYESSWMDSPALTSIIGQLFPSTYPTDPLALNGQNVSCDPAYASYCGPGVVAHLGAGASQGNACGTEADCLNLMASNGWRTGGLYYMGPYQAFVPYVAYVSWAWRLMQQLYAVTYVPGEVTIAPSGAPEILTPAQLTELADLISRNVASSPEVKTALDNIIKDHPETINKPYPIAKQDITNYLNNNIQNAYNDADTTINNLTQTESTTIANTQNDIEKAKEENKETFSPVPADAFNDPYQKDPVDFQTRLQTFFSRVKSTSLFSFSSGFFNSIPGGGSPVFHVPAGIYGDHYFDMSQYLTAGLAVLKATLLCIFSFLSIRAVVMKR